MTYEEILQQLDDEDLMDVSGKNIPGWNYSYIDEDGDKIILWVCEVPEFCKGCGGDKFECECNGG